MEEMQTLTGRVYDIQGFSVQDGPGIRTTVFLKGCPLRCPWCHSPESQSFQPQVCWIAMRCLGIEQCGRCLERCPTGALEPGRMSQNPTDGTEIQLVHIDRKKCTQCGACTEACYPNALYVCGTDYTVEQIVERVSKDIPFYKQSGGGVTVSGGEALSQPKFTVSLLKALKEKGIHTALDTTGHARWEDISAALPHTDLFLYDLKHMDNEKHKQVVGVPNTLIVENAKKIAEAGGKLQVRIPIIPRFNDDEENLRQCAALCKTLGDAVTNIQLLPYHNLGVVKYQRIDEDQTVLEATPPSEEKVQSLKALMEEFGLAVTVH